MCHNIQNGGLSVLFIRFSLFLHGFSLSQSFLRNSHSLSLTGTLYFVCLSISQGLDTLRMQHLLLFVRLRNGDFGTCLLLGLIGFCLRLALALLQLRPGIYLLLIFVGISLFLHLRLQLVLLDLNPLCGQFLLLPGLFNFSLDGLVVDLLVPLLCQNLLSGHSLHRLHVDDPHLLLRLNLIRGIRLSLLDILLHLQFRTLDGQFVVTDSDLGLGIDLCVIGLLHRKGLRLGNVTLGVGLVYLGLLAYCPSVVGSQILNQILVIRHILDVTGDDSKTQRLHVLLRLVHDFIRKLVPVDVDVAQGERAYHLTHITLQRILHLTGNVNSRHVKEVFGRKANPINIRNNLDFGDRIHIYINKIVGRDRTAGLDIGRHLTQKHLVHPFQERNAQTSLTDIYSGFTVQAGHNVGITGRGLNIGGQNNQQQNCDNNYNRNPMFRKKHESKIFNS